MELKFQKLELQHRESKRNKLKSRTSNGTKNKFVGVRQRPSGKWVAEIKNTSQKIRIWLGTFDTAEEAAHAYDEAAYLLRGSNTRTNFVISPSSDNSSSALSRRIRNLVNQKKNLNNRSQSPSNTASANITNDDANTSTSFQPLGFTGQMLDEKVCRPDVSRQFDYSWAFPEQFPPPFPEDLGIFTKQFSFATSTTSDAGNMSSSNEITTLEFERMKVERQISASLYAMNGVNDYLQCVCNTTDATTPSPNWDPPMLYHNFCLG